MCSNAVYSNTTFSAKARNHFLGLKEKTVHCIVDSLVSECFTLESAVRSSDGSNASLLLYVHMVSADSRESVLPEKTQLHTKPTNPAFKSCNSRFLISHGFGKVGECSHVCGFEFMEELQGLLWVKPSCVS